MALPTNTDSNAAFIREVDDEYRRDRMLSFWRRFGPAIAIGVIILAALIGGFIYWRNSQYKAAGIQGERLQDAYDALGAEQPAKAEESLATLATSGRDGYRALALMTQADVLLQRDDLTGAAAKFAAIANDDGLAKPFRDLALIRQTSAEFDTLKPQVIVERMRPLSVAGNPWFGSAGEMMAVAEVRQNRPDLAAALFDKIANDPTVPQSIRQRAVQMAATLQADGGATAADADKDQNAK